MEGTSIPAAQFFVKAQHGWFESIFRLQNVPFVIVHFGLCLYHTLKKRECVVIGTNSH
jgi:hypothetical protein